MLRVLCVVTSPYGRPGWVREVEDSPRVRHYLRVGVLWELPAEPEPEPATEPVPSPRKATRVVEGGGSGEE